jgi:cysteine desulfurase
VVDGIVPPAPKRSPGTDLQDVTYLDHAATSPLRPEVLEAMLAHLGERFGNPTGAHRLGRAARRALDDARDEVAAAVGCRPGEVVFTSGGTEADNLAVLGLADGPGSAVCPATEHHAVLHPVEEAKGTLVAVDGVGRVDLDALAAALDDRVRVVSVMLVNNETGTVNDLAAVADVVARHAPSAALHTDAVQAARWLDLTSAAGPAQLVSVSAHKLGGPVGVGALVVRDGVELRPRQLGGGQERGRRSGTQDVAGAVGLATALRLAVAEREDVVARVSALRDRLADGLRATVGGLVETAAPDGDRRHLVAGTCHVCVPGVPAEALLFLLDDAGICASAASSCSSGAQQASHVLAAMGVPLELATGSLRLTLGPSTTDADVDRALAVIPAAVDRLRDGS